MATDARFDYKNNQKKTLSVFASGYISTAADMDVTLFTLPVNSLVKGVYVHVYTASGTATDTVDVKVGSTVVANEVVVGTTGTKTGAVTAALFTTGGTVSVVAGADAPGTVGVICVVVEYIEIDLANGTYTD
jgi:hypothetical protein